MGLLLGATSNVGGFNSKNRQAVADMAKADAASGTPLVQRVEQQAGQYRDYVRQQNEAANASGSGESDRGPVTMQDTVAKLTGIRIEDPDNLDYQNIANQVAGSRNRHNQTYTEAFETGQLEKRAEADQAAVRAAEVATQRMREGTLAREAAAAASSTTPVLDGTTADVQLSLGEAPEDEEGGEDGLGRRRRARESYRGSAGIKI